MLRSLSQWPRLTRVQPPLLQLQRVPQLRVLQPLLQLALLQLALLRLVLFQPVQLPLVQLQPAQLPLLPPVPLASHRQRRLSAG